MTFIVVTFFAMSAVSASAAMNGVVKVGLRYGDTALFSANLENQIGAGYFFGYYDDARAFNAVGWTGQTAISMTASGDIHVDQNGTYSREAPAETFYYMGPWHVQLNGYASFEEAATAAAEYGGYPAWIDWEYVVRIGCYGSQEEAVAVAAEYGVDTVVQSTSTGVLVTVTRSTEVLFEFDCSGVLTLGVQPDGLGETAVTWFKGYKYPGGFEYPRQTGGDLNVYNVVDVESYVKGVIPYEMNNEWPLAALEAQAICARTYASKTRHTSYGFDVCNTTDCQVYYGWSGSGSNGPNANTDAAVDNTAGLMLYHQGEVIQNAVYHSSNGGATEDIINVWGSTNGYLVGKEDPYETPIYSWSVTYTADELTYILQQKEYDIGKVKNVYVSEYTPLGNVKKVTFEGTKGTKTFTGEACRTIFYSSTYGKSVKSMRYGINGSRPSSSTVYVNDKNTSLNALSGVSVLSGKGILGTLNGKTFTVLSSSGIATVKGSSSATQTPTSSNHGVFLIEGTGNGHNLGMSQRGAKSMAELGYTYQDILEFYYTDITIM